VAGKNSNTHPSFWRPHPDSRVQASRGNADSVKGYSIDLVIMSLEHSKTLSSIKVPEPRSAVIATADSYVPSDIQASDTVRVSSEEVQALSFLDIPDTKGGVS